MDNIIVPVFVCLFLVLVISWVFLYPKKHLRDTNDTLDETEEEEEDTQRNAW